MPSPFPGMDPWLEDPAEWPSVHGRIIADLQSALNAVVRPKYRAVIEKRVYISDDPDRDRPVRVPDVQVQLDRPAGTVQVSGLDLTQPNTLVLLRRPRLREWRIKVIEAGTKAVVTVIELVSPTNKRSESNGRASFTAKRDRVLASSANWVEIDLLRAGTPTFPRRKLPPGDYAVHVSPASIRPKSRAWSIRLPDRLPVIGIPLLPADSDALIDLQVVLADAYERGAFDAGVDYRRPPVPPLPPELDGWADALLKEKGLR